LEETPTTGEIAALTRVDENMEKIRASKTTSTYLIRMLPFNQFSGEIATHTLYVLA
jgi:hypothetical protein